MQALIGGSSGLRPVMCCCRVIQAIQHQGQTYYYASMCFGLASACEAYTTLMGEVLRPLRGGQLASERLTTMIDDTQIVYSSRNQAKFRTYTVALIYAALGFFLSLDKCSLVPVQQNKFLGLILDSSALRFIVPADKVERFKLAAASFLQSSRVTARRIAQLAGLILSFAPAVALAALFTRELYQAISGVSVSTSVLYRHAVDRPDDGEKKKAMPHVLSATHWACPCRAGMPLSSWEAAPEKR